MSTNTPGVGDHVASTPNKSAWQKFIELEPAVLRGILITVAALVAQIIGKTVVTDDTVDLIIDLFTGISALVAALWTRPAVTANARVLAFQPRPFESETPILPGKATIPLGNPGLAAQVVNAAQGEPLRRAA